MQNKPQQDYVFQSNFPSLNIAYGQQQQQQQQSSVLNQGDYSTQQLLNQQYNMNMLETYNTMQQYKQQQQSQQTKNYTNNNNTQQQQQQQQQQTQKSQLKMNSSVFIPGEIKENPLKQQQQQQSIQQQQQQQQINNGNILTRNFAANINTLTNNNVQNLLNISYLNSTTPPPTSLLSNEQSINNSFSTTNTITNVNDKDNFDKVVQQIINLRNHEKRESALQELSKKRESCPNLAPALWNSVGTIAILLQEIVAIYPFLTPPNLTQQASNRVCSVLGLLQNIALHQETRGQFLSAHIPLFLYPFLNTSSKSKSFENLRVTSLGVIGALVKGDDTDAIAFLLQTEIIPLCLRIMRRGMELSRTVATFIVQKILHDESGLTYICQTAERFFAVVTVLNHMIEDLVAGRKDDQRLLRHIIRCYFRLSINERANEALKKCLPEILKLKDQEFITDDSVKKCHLNLLQTLGFM